MTVKQHKNATTTPEIRAFIRASELPTAVLARLLKISESTVRKWRQRETLEDASHIPKHSKTTLTLQQQYVVVQYFPPYHQQTRRIWPSGTVFELSLSLSR